MNLTTRTTGKRTVGGAIAHSVINEKGEMIGWINEVFSDVFYVKPFGRLYKDNTRYRSFSAALLSPEWANAKPGLSAKGDFI